MADRILTIHVQADVEEKLTRLAESTRRSKERLLSEAVSTYIEQEEHILAQIHDGLEDIEAGRVVDHDVAMAELDAVIAASRSRRK